ncbi:oxygenase MpaB family protein [Massilia putida]|uniref:oxygenase MpaB family protein n=1 Tax=Massilia putida TaxID=1141883 RepID=UPI0009515A5F|nr:oxygenase MpaB family protein [Massilia putida]
MRRDFHEPGLRDDPALRADPLADATIARILGPGRPGGPDTETIAVLNKEIARWQLNGDLDGWRASPGLPAEMAAALEDYVAKARVLPDWADAARIARSEVLFMDMSMASCTLLFCASLPQCYVIPDLAAVLHAAGELEQHTDYRVRATAAMIFPVMMHGGLLDPAGGGVAQAIKVRLIHAMIRHLVLRGDVAEALVAPRRLPPLHLPTFARGGTMHQVLYAHGWDIDRLGLPCNQQELAYTLLTFHYVFLHGLRRLGLGLDKGDEEAYMHTWNVLGCVLGIEPGLMADTMTDAARMFADIQTNARGQARKPDPRPALAGALVATMQRYIPLRLLKPFPVLLTRHLVGKDATRDLGLDGHVSLLSRALFVLGFSLVRGIDAIGRLVFPGFSISRLVTRILGYRLTAKLLMDETRPLALPATLLNEVSDAMRAWHNDDKAPRWMNAIERRFTGRAMPDARQG